jgi:hypothetical protein
MDGVDQLNNVLVIGMTNRKDMIDDALLRPGRFEIHIEISLPDEAGRVQILNIHTSRMKENKVMAADVDVNELAGLTKNFSGAELQGLVKSATSFAFNRHIKVGTMAGVSDDVSNMQITRADFMEALNEVHAAFGVAEEELTTVVDNGIIHYSSDIEVRLGTMMSKCDTRRPSCVTDDCLWTRSKSRKGLIWSAFCFMVSFYLSFCNATQSQSVRSDQVPLDRERPHWPRPSPLDQITPLSN